MTFHMTEAFASETSTRVSRIIRAARKSVYDAFLDPESVVAWLPPNHMRGHVHVFDARVGGAFRISLTCQEAEHPVGGKTSADTDSFEGRFVELGPYEKIVEVVEFESQDPVFAGEMRITVSLADADGGTEIVSLCEDIPRGIRLEHNEQGCRESLQKLAALLE